MVFRLYETCHNTAAVSRNTYFAVFFRKNAYLLHKTLTFRRFVNKTFTFARESGMFLFTKSLHLCWQEQDVFLDDFRQNLDFLIGEFLKETSAAFWEFTVVLLHKKNELRCFLVRHVNDVPHT